jgi:hypothetical protein
VIATLGTGAQDIDAQIHQIVDRPGLLGYIAVTPDGIPLRHHEGLPYSKVTEFAALACELHLRSKQTVSDMFGKTDTSELVCYRIRDRVDSEIVVTCHNDFLLVVIQKCK